MGERTTTLLFGVGGLLFMSVVVVLMIPFFFAPVAATSGAAGAAAACLIDQSSAAGGGGGTVRPVSDIGVSSPFGMRDGEHHVGVDYPGGGLDAPIHAFGDGEVVRAEPATGFGTWIVLTHMIGGQLISTVYGHMYSDDLLVEAGDRVTAGQQIARIGNNGESTGPHLHFEYWIGERFSGNGRPVDPHPYVQAAQDPVLPGGEARDGGGPAGFELPAPDGPGMPEQPEHAGDIPANYLAAYQAAGQAYGVPWQLLAGIGYAESKHGRSELPGVHFGYNEYGCCAGPMQFYANREMAGGTTTWDTYGVDGNGDSESNVYDIEDAAFGAANLLVESGVKNGPLGVWGALRAYNNSHAYANDVLRYASEYAAGGIAVVPGDESGLCEMGAVTSSGGDTSRGAAGADPRDLRLDWPEEDASEPDPTSLGRITPRMKGVLDALPGAPSRPSSIGCVAHRATRSDHPDGRACDLMYVPANTPENIDAGWAMANWLVDNQRNLGVKYVIWQGMIWTAGREPWHWRTYTNLGCPNPADITSCHYDHVHVSVY